MLGFSGHFSTKSRTYSTTLGALRADRAAYQRKQAIAAGLLPDLDNDRTVVLARWSFTGRAEVSIGPQLRTIAGSSPPDPAPGGDRPWT
jgi:hypothetical protein